MKPLLVLLLGAPVGVALGAGIGAVIGWAYCHSCERRLERDWG